MTVGNRFTLFALLALEACSGAQAPQTLPAALSVAAAPESHGVAVAACSGSRVGRAQCDALVLTGGVHTSPAGWSASQLQSAYKLPSAKKGNGQIVAIVDAYDNPNVISDLAYYRTAMGLSAGTFYKYNEYGQQYNYPQPAETWGVEEDLDVDMVSASCPNCTIILIEATTSAWSDLETAEAEAITLGATIVSNSYTGTGGDESAFDTPGITYLASSGDYGYGLRDPATFQDVVAVGGTMLSQGGGKRGYTETVWNVPSCCSTGGGCSTDTDEPKPSWQHDPSCTYRTGSDVAAVAWDVAEYDTFDEPGWIETSGTSVASPLLAGVYALAGNSTKQEGGKAFWTMKKKKLKKDLYAVSSGSTAGCPSYVQGTYLCTAGTNQFGQFSGPDGWGTPHGIGAF